MLQEVTAQNFIVVIIIFVVAVWLLIRGGGPHDPDQPGGKED